jgi:glycolate oxidase
VHEQSSGVRQELVDALIGLLGKDCVNIDRETLDRCGRDETEDLFFPPDIVVIPHSVEQIAALMRFATEHKLPVTPRGGGTGLSGGALAVEGGICLSMERFSTLLEIDTQNCQATVEPGVTTQRLQEAAAEAGLYYPPDPSSRGTSHMGGNIAEGAGGPHAVKYGVTKDYVLGLEAVLPTGEFIKTGGRNLKDVTGYNLTQLLIGSEGTLAIVTKIFVRLIPMPKFRKVALIAFGSLTDAAAAVARIFQKGITPSALEFLEKAAVKVAEERQGKKFPNSDAEAQLLVEVDGNHEQLLQDELMAIAEVAQESGALDILLAEDRQKIEDVWTLRRGIGEAVKSISAYKEEDTVVPRAMLPQLIDGVKKICAVYHITSICYGHAGDGNVHVNILKENLDDATWERNVDAAIREIFALTLSLGGAISGEHGIGYAQRGYLAMALGPAELRLMREIKHTFDPAGILNPGKIFP